MPQSDLSATENSRSARPMKPVANVGISREDRFRPTAPGGLKFRNPILPAPSADPCVVRHDGYYYSCESRRRDSIWIRRARSFTDLSQDTGTLIWTAPPSGPGSKSLWAPELQLLDGKWYIYYAADDGLNENHRMWVLEGLTNDPCGPYQLRGTLETDGWAIDGTVLLRGNGSHYFLWSGWPGKENGRQNLYIAPMSNPWTLSATRSLLLEPTESWETVDMAICEGPQVLQHAGRTFVVYSASGSWTEDYCLGLLELTGDNPLSASCWQKRGCVFQKTDWVWGVGHCSFVQSRDAGEDWIIYHAKSKRKKGWNDRSVRAQKFSWTPEGLPQFGLPVSAGVDLDVPAGYHPIEMKS